jgi:hypothetical protein
MLISIPLRFGKRMPDSRIDAWPILFHSFIAEEIHLAMLDQTLATTPWERIRANDESLNILKSVQEPCYANRLLEVIECLNLQEISD